MDDPSAEFQAPAGPPAFLSDDELFLLCQQGYLTISLPEHLKQETDQFFSASSDFFGLPKATKQKLYPLVLGALEHGYSHIPSEKEFLTLRYRSVNEDQPLVEQLLSQVWHDLSHLLYRILVDVGDYICVDAEAWHPLVEPSLSLPRAKTAVPSLLRSFRYEPLSGVADPHNDLGLITICICRGSGLQVWERPGTPGTESTPSLAPTQPDGAAGAEGQWADAGEVTLLVGDTLRLLSANRVRAGRHRVVANPEGRSSVVFALRPSTQGSIDLHRFGGEGEIEAKLLWDRIKGNRINVNAQKHVREQQRLKRTEQKCAQ